MLEPQILQTSGIGNPAFDIVFMHVAAMTCMPLLSVLFYISAMQVSIICLIVSESN